MEQITHINHSLPETEPELDAVISELMEREEFLCTGQACGADTGFI